MISDKTAQDSYTYLTAQKVNSQYKSLKTKTGMHVLKHLAAWWYSPHSLGDRDDLGYKNKKSSQLP